MVKFRHISQHFAEELQLNGLNGESGGEGEGDDNLSEQYAKPTTLINTPYKKKGSDQSMNPAKIDFLNSELGVKCQNSSNMAAALLKHEFSGNMQALYGQIETLVARVDTMVKGNQMRNGEWFIFKGGHKE